MKVVLTTRPAYFRAAFGFRHRGADIASTQVTRANRSAAHEWEEDSREQCVHVPLTGRGWIADG